MAGHPTQKQSATPTLGSMASCKTKRHRTQQVDQYSTWNKILNQKPNVPSTARCPLLHKQSPERNNPTLPLINSRSPKRESCAMLDQPTYPAAKNTTHPIFHQQYDLQIQLEGPN